jgi:hypothetical protein
MTKPSLDLFPDPGMPSNPPTWEDIERLAMHYPSAHNVVTLVERGDITREQALISLVYWFATGFSRQFKRESDALALEVPDTIVAKDCGCSTHTYIRRRAVHMACESHGSADAVARGPASEADPPTRD